MASGRSPPASPEPLIQRSSRARDSTIRPEPIGADHRSSIVLRTLGRQSASAPVGADRRLAGRSRRARRQPARHTTKMFLNVVPTDPPVVFPPKFCTAAHHSSARSRSLEGARPQCGPLCPRRIIPQPIPQSRASTGLCHRDRKSHSMRRARLPTAVGWSITLDDRNPMAVAPSKGIAGLFDRTEPIILFHPLAQNERSIVELQC